MIAVLRVLFREAVSTISTVRRVLARWALAARWSDRIAMAPRVSIGPGVRVNIEGDGHLELAEGVELVRTHITIGRGCNVKFGAGSTINSVVLEVTQGGSLVTGPAFRANTLVPGATTAIVIRGGSATLGKSIYIDGGSYRVLDAGTLEIADGASIGTDSEVRAELRVRIGRYAMISYRVSIFDTNTHSLDHQERRAEVERYPAYDRGQVRRAPVEIGDDCWIGLGAAILKGVVIGPRSVVGLNTTVTAGSYPADSIIVSAGARIVTKQAR